ncbi:exonuclease domain-containing protein [Corynebacterium pelargi]|uniref:DNA polymerase III PolC-type n=1 Tax=Corynebacterium pelargi TaxID=1471400 RepID=A0A410W992_9CORY|nr:exonuclease domain-containing protein [Corynebacterium pelargi]QAU52523.1 DNA polymerase III PolC-type [Corynebacterium pelargi]GGG77016.1 DNA polymerase III subunit epsilon [Corynebacterium pelargi]
MFGLFQSKAKPTGALAQMPAWPAPATPLDELNLLAVDIETTGFDAKRDHLISIGWVPINGGEIQLSGAGYTVVKSEHTVGDSATIHQLTDAMVAKGVEQQTALELFLEALESRVLLAHFASLETSFLDVLCQQYFNAPLRAPVVDTFALERRHMERMGTYPRGEDLRLARVRERYGLPWYGNHNALSDALACAELYLALRVHTKANTLKALQNSQP